MKMKYCPNCDKMVITKSKEFNWGAFLCWTFLTLGFGIWVYPLYYVIADKQRCVNCHCEANLYYNPAKPVYKKDLIALEEEELKKAD